MDKLIQIVAVVVLVPVLVVVVLVPVLVVVQGYNQQIVEGWMVLLIAVTGGDRGVGW